MHTAIALNLGILEGRAIYILIGVIPYCELGDERGRPSYHLDC